MQSDNIASSTQKIIQSQFNAQNTNSHQEFCGYNLNQIENPNILKEAFVKTSEKVSILYPELSQEQCLNNFKQLFEQFPKVCSLCLGNYHTIDDCGQLKKKICKIAKQECKGLDRILKQFWKNKKEKRKKLIVNKLDQPLDLEISFSETKFSELHNLTSNTQKIVQQNQSQLFETTNDK